MAKNAHLTYDERLTIQSSLADRLSFKAIGLILGKDPSTIAKEVKGHLKIEEKGSFNPCLHRKTCIHKKDVCKPCKMKYGQNCRTCTEA
ncbi:MAG: helix-turn-helix domain-containing protein, partial [Lachnospiraceae bacterium]|nr:helix-turn-helix domain-containing protein [Lachnospiraceae bacterium]